MVLSKRGRLTRWVRRMQGSFRNPSSGAAADIDSPAIDLSNPLVNYYRHRSRTNLPSFYRFAIQSRSIDIRDIFAQVASTQHLTLDDLIHLIPEYLRQESSPEQQSRITSSFDSSVLLALGDLLANTAQDDLDTYAAVQIYDFVRTYFGDDTLAPANLLQNVEALHELGEYEQSQTIAQAHNINEIAPLQTELLDIQRLRRESSSINEWLAALNKMYASLNMSELRLLEDASLPLMDRLSARSTVAVDGPKVSIIVPTFSPGEGIKTALRGLLEQTWQNLEIIVVNDASPNQFDRIFEEIEQLDPRVQIIHQRKNAGAYVARNAGLRAATGDFITTHDDDDWSHPDKIATQVVALIDDESLVATTSSHIRTTENLDLKRVNAEARFLQMNYSSLMFRRSLVNEIGDWDPVNRGGDSEYYSRILAFAGPEKILGLHDHPLSFSRIWDGSLTSGEMHRGFFGYSRLVYRWAFRQWHRETIECGEHLSRSSQDPRPYAVPTTFEAGQRNADLGKFDVIYVSDFFRQAKGVNQALNEMEALADTGLRIGYMHLYSPETRSTFSFSKRLFDLQLEGKVTQVSVDDVAQTNLLLVYDISIGMFLDRIETNISALRGVAVEQKLVSLADVEPRTPSFIPQALVNLDACFDTRFEVVGATQEDQSQLKDTVPSARVLDDEMIWHTHVSEEPGEIIVPTSVPTIGFHSDSNQYRWPNTLEQFKSVYISDEYTTSFYGQVEKPLQKFGAEVLQDVEIVDWAAHSELEFLRHVNFWVYWPHSRMRDQIWEPVLSALWAGKVVILPQRLKWLYGDSAVYAEPDQISSLISFFVRDPDAYVKQAERAQAFVTANYTRNDLMRRINTLMETTNTDTMV